MFKEAELSPKRKKLFWILAVPLALLAGFISYEFVPKGTSGHTWLVLGLMAVVVALYAALGGFRRGKPDDRS